MSNTAQVKMVHNDNGPIAVEHISRVTTTITVDNFMHRMDRLRQLDEDEFQRTAIIKSFKSETIPLSHPRATNDGDAEEVYSVAAEVECKRQVSYNLYFNANGSLSMAYLRFPLRENMHLYKILYSYCIALISTGKHRCLGVE